MILEPYLQLLTGRFAHRPITIFRLSFVLKVHRTKCGVNCIVYTTPIVVDVARNGFDLTNSIKGIDFNLNKIGEKGKTGLDKGQRRMCCEFCPQIGPTFLG